VTVTVPVTVTVTVPVTVTVTVPVTVTVDLSKPGREYCCPAYNLYIGGAM
jgi:hypothetical protein